MGLPKPHVIRFLISFHGLGDVLHPLDGAADVRVFDNRRLVGDTGGGGVACGGSGGQSEVFSKGGFMEIVPVYSGVWGASPEMSEMSMSVGNSLF